MVSAERLCYWSNPLEEVDARKMAARRNRRGRRVILYTGEKNQDGRQLDQLKYYLVSRFWGFLSWREEDNRES